MDISELKPGDKHYMAYVGPPTQYDFMGATQFCLLFVLGLRAHHHVLDFGCGSLRAGRLFISYLDKSRYFGIDPNYWLIEDGIKNHVGKDLIGIKKPKFDDNRNFASDVFDQKFDFILAQSIFSHSGSDIVETALHNFKTSLKPGGLIAATFIEGANDFSGSGWVYPDCVHYRHSTILQLSEKVCLFTMRIPWYHPRQTWYLLAEDARRLPNLEMMRHLSGAVLFDSEFKDSWEKGHVS